MPAASDKSSHSGRIRSAFAPSASSRSARLGLYKASVTTTKPIPGMINLLALRDELVARRESGTHAGPLGNMSNIPRTSARRRPRTMNMKAMDQHEQEEQAEKARRLAMMPEEAHAARFVAQTLGSQATSNMQAGDLNDFGMDGVDEDEDVHMGHVEELGDQEGGQTLVESMWDFCRKRHHRVRTRHRAGTGAHARRLAASNEAWEAHIPVLVQAYMRWRHGPAHAEHGSRHEQELGHDPAPAQESASAQASESQLGTAIYLMTLSGIHKRSFICEEDGQSLAVHLLERGFLPTSPIQPRMAICMEVMELLHHARLRAYVSHEAFMRILCDLQGRLYRPYFRLQLSQAYDAYVLIILELERLVKHAFGHDVPNWRMLNACSACDYRLEGEPELPHTKLMSMDGHNSSKRFLHAGHQDHRQFKSDYMLSSDFVDQFKKEDHGSAKDKTLTHPHGNPQGEDIKCTDKWKTSNARERPSHWMDGLDATGNFLCSCRHGMIVCSVDMLQSGELSKYPLACMQKTLSVYGQGLGIGYDIGCDHQKTLANSTIGKQAQELNLRMYVGAFHGYAHNRKCQLMFHPRFLMTAGLETFETNEWIFSKQNLTAHLFRYASAYHRHMTLHFFWMRWDEDRRAGLADLMLKNYVNALNIISETLPELHRIQVEQHLSDQDIQRYIQEEQDYFDRLQHEDDADDLQFKYLETLKELQTATQQLQSFDVFINTTPETFNDLPRNIKERTLKANYNSMLRAHERYERLALRYEAELGTDRWTADSAEWKQAELALARRKYNLALDELEGLVVQRLFEMEKLHLRGTGYAMRTSIAKAMQERSGAIRSALEKYNALATTLQPPRPTLDYQDVINMSFLSDFALLRYSRDDIRKRRWSDPLIRQAMLNWLLIRCAKEEIKRLNVEIRRVWTALHVEPLRMLKAIRRVEAEGDVLLAANMRLRLSHHQEVSKHLYKRILAIFDLEGFSGDRSVGIRMGQYHRPDTNMSSEDECMPMPKTEEDAWEDIGPGDVLDDGEVDDDVLDEFERLNQAFENMGLAQ